MTYNPDRAVSTADTLAITASFDEAMRATPTIVIQNATGDTIQTATAMTGNAGDTVWTFNFTVPDGNSGDATVFIDGLDIAGNGNQTPSNNTFTIDNSKPEVAITYDPDRAVSSADTMAITATFAQGMRAFTQISIVNATGDTIQTATAMTGTTGDTVWTFNFDVPGGNSGDATVTVAGLDIAGNANQAPTNEIFTTFNIDNKKPTVALTYNPDRAVSSADTLSVTATFGQGMRESPQISIVNVSDVTIQAATAMTGTTGDTVWTFDFMVPDGNSGTATVTIDGQDIAGNNNETATNNTFTIDNGPPTVALTYNPDRAVSSADTLTITADFSENMRASPTISIVNATGDTIQAVTAMTGNAGDTTWTFDFTVPDGNSGDATVTIDGLDIAGNTNQPASDNTFTIDNKKPIVALTYNPDRAVSSADTLAITATFTEGMSASPQISIVNATGDSIQVATSMTGNAGDTTWTFNFSVPDGNSGDATVIIVGTDVAGNSNEAATNTSFTIDNKAPTLALTYNFSRPVSSADTLAITATFGQGMRASPKIVIQNTTGDTIQAATAMTGSTGDTVWTFNFAVPDGNSGDATVTISGTDVAGNGNQSASNSIFTIDNKKPTVALTYNPDRAVNSADTLAITATFSQGMSASPQISIVNATGDSIQAATSMTGSAGDTVWTFNFDVPASNSGDTTVTITGTDIAGNSNEAASNNTFTIDTSPPVIEIDSVTTASGDANSFTFSHSVSGTNRLLVVSVQTSNGIVVDTVTHAGQNLTEFASMTHAGSKPYVSTWRLVAPSTGSNNVVVTLSVGNSDKTVIGAVSYIGVDQSTPIDGVVTGDGSSNTITATVTSESNDLVQDVVASLSPQQISVGAGQTARWNFEMGGVGASSTWGGSSTEPGAGTVTMTWGAVGNKEWVIAAFNLNVAC